MDNEDKNEDKRAKRREQKRRYRATHRTYRLNFTLKAARELERLASEKGMDVPQYIKALISSGGTQTGYILPRDSKLNDLLLALRRVGNNINQLTRYCHSNHEVTYTDIRNLKSHLGQIEDVVTKALQYPPEITEILKEHLDQNPQSASALMDFIKHNYSTFHGH